MRGWFWFAAAGFVLSTAVHVRTFFPGVRISMNDVWPLHLWAMAAFAPGVVVAARRQRAAVSAARSQAPARGGWWARYRSDQRMARASFRQFVSLVPPAARAAAVALFAYAFANFALFLGRTEGGSPEAVDGRYELRDHGRKVRDLTPAEFRRHQANLVRGFSGHWMVFLFMPTLYFRWIEPATRGGVPTSAGAVTPPQSAAR